MSDVTPPASDPPEPTAIDHTNATHVLVGGQWVERFPKTDINDPPEPTLPATEETP